MSSTICFNLDLSKILSSRNGLIYYRDELYQARHYLILSETTNFRLFQTEIVCRLTILNFYEKGGKFFKQVENTVEKGAIARYEQKTCTPDNLGKG